MAAWIEGIKAVTLRVGLVSNRNLSVTASFSTLLTASPTNTDSSSDLDTEIHHPSVIFLRQRGELPPAATGDGRNRSPTISGPDDFSNALPVHDTKPSVHSLRTKSAPQSSIPWGSDFRGWKTIQQQRLARA